jgi:molybdate transport system substrate-binding protein
MRAPFASLTLGVLVLSACSSTGTATAPNEVTKVVTKPEPALQVYAAGSLRGAMTTIAKDFEASTGQKVVLTFGASGLLRERIEKGEGAQVFASADTDHPQRLARQGGWQTPQVFVRNTLCALTSDKINATPATVMATLLRPDVRLGTSTPKSDPSGDYTWALFEKANGVQSGAYAVLNAKAQKLAGAADSPKAPDGISTYGWIMDTNQVDMFITYCTNAVAARAEVPRLKVVQFPPALSVGAAYGMTVRQGAPAVASAFAAALLAPQGQAVFSRLGFGAP